MRDGPANLEKCMYACVEKQEGYEEGSRVMCGGYIIRAYIIIPLLYPHTRHLSSNS